MARRGTVENIATLAVTSLSTEPVITSYLYILENESMMTILKLLKAVTDCSQYKDWLKAHEHCYLTHIFFMMDGDDIHSFDIGYFHKETNKMTSFAVDAQLKEVSLAGESEVFKEPDTSIKPLDVSKVSVEGEDALLKASVVQSEKYPKEKPFKKVVILQHLDEGQVWNITYITESFKTLNIKIDASSGEVLDDKIVKLIQMGNE